jgi:hypothetical protein
MTKFTFEQANEMRERFAAKYKETGMNLKKFERNLFGLVSDEVRASEAYRAAKNAHDEAFKSYRLFNTFFLNAFAMEYAESREEKKKNGTYAR